MSWARRMRALRLAGACLAASAGALLAAAALLNACAAEQRHRTLSFFFDGVPDPNAPTTTTMTRTRKRPPLLPHRPAQPIAVPAALPYVSQHKPFAERQCGGCHDMRAGNDALTRNEQLCDKCHLEERVRGNWRHGPINLGLCIPCHKAHQSPYPHLLEEPIPQLCVRCHEDALERRPQYHEVAKLEECLRCHDAHRGTTYKGVP